MERVKDYGITKEHFSGSLIYGIVVTVAGLIVLPLYGMVAGSLRFPESLDWLFILYYVILSVPVQEFLFRGVIQTELTKKTGWIMGVTITALLFGLIHYPNAILIIFTIVAGWFWGLAFKLQPNLIGPWLSHSVLGLFLFFFVL